MDRNEIDYMGPLARLKQKTALITPNRKCKPPIFTKVPKITGFRLADLTEIKVLMRKNNRKVEKARRNAKKR